MSNSGSMNQLGSRSRQDSLVGTVPVLPTAAAVGGMQPMIGGMGQTVAPNMAMGMGPGVNVAAATGASSTGDAWVVPLATRRKYTQHFNELDKQKRGWLNGAEARTVLMQSGLGTQQLAEVWNLADVDVNGRLMNDEFVLAMYLIELCRAGQKLPPKLPLEFIPLAFRPAGMPVQAAFPQPVVAPIAPMGMVMGPQPVPQPMPNVPQNGAAEQPAVVTALDSEAKRRENFLKGQEELARRQEALKEQLRRDEEARREKQRAEEERLQREREERERARLAELERQRERARQLEQERQDAMRREQEAREHARREIEMRRLVDQLTMERAREQQAVEQSKLVAANLKSECENVGTFLYLRLYGLPW